MSDERLINDAVHGHITLPSQFFKVIDTVEFQRLRDIKQVGTLSYVFPCAVHTRFEHSIGTAHLAKRMLFDLMSKDAELKDSIPREARWAVPLGGLCHDLGHGPFSHVFDQRVVPEIYKELGILKEWKHEDASVMMFEHMMGDNEIKFNDEETCEDDIIRMTSAVIDGRNIFSSEHDWLFDIVANKKNSIDVDKFDYIARDHHHTGRLDTYFDWERMMLSMEVIDGRICLEKNQGFAVQKLFNTRFQLFKEVYCHDVSMGVEFMIVDILKAANGVYEFHKQLQDPQRYKYLGDSILNEIERSQSPELEKSRDLIRDLRRRRLYHLVGECLYPSEGLRDEDKVRQDFLNSCETDTTITKDDFVLCVLDLNYANGTTDPISKVDFYDKKEQKRHRFSQNTNSISLLTPKVYSERVLRVFSKNREKTEALQEKFKVFRERFQKGR
eukprot:CAMPEP_0115042894 /NCGR_PEP_ID=MMETSP0216-20121206/46538_1 /TAXON_ID=223996 /ORGANISM="Protocruzia adherens, Strain Boccale" /LENGTH=441 /DNA_ID=CAMNT_0002425097 /DNA_START=308 /DNA_END=1633 /DNA_ORIENTATION=-